MAISPGRPLLLPFGRERLGDGLGDGAGLGSATSDNPFCELQGQPADGTIDVTAGSVYLTVVLPWLFAVMARAAEPLIVREGTAMLERK